MDTLESSPVSATDIITWTSKDPVLSRVKELVLQGWVDTTDEQLQLYQQRKDELSIHAGCVLLGSRVVVLLQVVKSLWRNCIKVTLASQE